MSALPSLKVSTMKPFEKGDIFLGCTYLNDINDDHAGEGRILQFDKNWRPKGVLYTEGTKYLIVGCRFAPDGTLWAFDSQNYVVVRVSPEGKQLDNWLPGRGFGSVSFCPDGSLVFGEYFIGNEIWKGTTCQTQSDGRLGDGDVYKYTKDFELVNHFPAENAPEFTKFKGVTHSTMHPSGEFITYTTETARRLMRLSVSTGEQMEDLAGFPDADPNDREDKRWFIAPDYLSDGRLLCTTAEGLQIFDESGDVLKTIPLPGYGWAQVCADVDERYALAANVWTGVAARIDLEGNDELELIDTGFTAPFRSLAGIAVCKG